MILTGCFSSCEKSDLSENQEGIAPSSINQVVDVFELKYGEVKENIYEGQVFKFSIVDVVDSIFCYPSETTYIPPDIYNTLRMHAFLYLEIGEKRKISRLKVSSQRCHIIGEFKNDGTDVQQVWDELQAWQSDPPIYNFENTFVLSFYTGTLIKNTSFSIFMAKAYPFACNLNYIPPQSMYKFIFIITNQNIK